MQIFRGLFFRFNSYINVFKCNFQKQKTFKKREIYLLY